MFNKNFYPTPQNLIAKMLENVKIERGQTILEPSAGKGDIVDYLYKKYDTYNHYREEFDIDCIEIEDELQATLKGKNYRVVHNDFLTFNTNKQYDLIIMNPPFDNGEKHLLKALKMQSHGGNIICLLNAETIKNPYTNERKDLVTQLEKYNANIEFIENSFVDAERPTNVEVALIKVEIPQQEQKCQFLDELRQTETYEDIYDTTSTELTRFTEQYDFVENAVEQYNTEVKLGLKLIKEYYAMKPYIKNSLDETDTYSSPMLSLVIGESYNHDTATPNEFVKKVRYKYWKALFKNPRFTDKLTSNLIEELNNTLNKLRDYDFSVYNIMTIQQELMQKTLVGVEDTILKLFDEFSAQYTYFDEGCKNIHYYNGWKTNKAWKINTKVILPHDAYSSWDKSLELNYHHTTGKFSDIIKVFHFLAGKTKNDIQVSDILEINQRLGNNKDIDFGYFTVTFYKKGTTHIVFKDTKLLDKFNLFGSQKKGWLPPNFMKKGYADLNKEEQETVNEFCGEEKYNEFMKDKDYYLCNSNNLLLIENKN